MARLFHAGTILQLHSVFPVRDLLPHGNVCIADTVVAVSLLWLPVLLNDGSHHEQCSKSRSDQAATGHLQFPSTCLRCTRQVFHLPRPIQAQGLIAAQVLAAVGTDERGSGDCAAY